MVVAVVIVGGALVLFLRGSGASVSGAGTSPSGRTTESILREQGPDCFACAQRNGCMDPAQQGGTCEGTPGQDNDCGSGMTETAVCLKTMEDLFRSKCAASLQMTPCLCGAANAADCLAGTAPPTGPMVADYQCGFRTSDVNRIQSVFTNQKYGAGQANAMVQCLAAYSCRCFGQAEH
jgi:hypothetical protein